MTLLTLPWNKWMDNSDTQDRALKAGESLTRPQEKGKPVSGRKKGFHGDHTESESHSKIANLQSELVTDAQVEDFSHIFVIPQYQEERVQTRPT